MTRFAGLLRCTLFGLMLVVASSCGGDNPFGNEPGVYLVRVLNSLPDAITVTIGPANYGSIAPNQTTAYMQVANGDNQVLLNGQVFQASPAEFADGFPGTLRWTYEFAEDSWGFSSDDFQGPERSGMRRMRRPDRFARVA